MPKSFLESQDLTPFLSGGLFSGLFGGDEEKWKPYYDEQGRYVWENPKKKNPVPKAEVPGAPLAPSKAYRKAASNIQATVDLMPFLNEAINSNILPTALANLEASKATSGPYAELMLQLYNQYGPALNEIGNEIARRNKLAESSSDLEVLKGPGKDVVKEAYDLSQVFDKPYYDTRDLSAKRYADLVGSIDLTGALSQTERDEINKGLTIEGMRRGTGYAPSNTDVVANAMQYGNAGFQRKQSAQDSLSKALAVSSQMMPAMKSGVDVFQVATGKSSAPNSGDARFTGINTNTQQGANLASQLGNNMFGGINQMQQTQMQIDSQKKDWLDKFVQFTQGMSNVGSMFGNMAGGVAMCWVAREVYGADNPRWQQFREWLIYCAPKWFYIFYAKHGMKIAEFIRNKPVIKWLIRKWMDSKICQLERVSDIFTLSKMTKEIRIS